MSALLDFEARYPLSFGDLNSMTTSSQKDFLRMGYYLLSQNQYWHQVYFFNSLPKPAAKLLASFG